MQMDAGLDTGDMLLKTEVVLDSKRPAAAFMINWHRREPDCA